MRYVPAYSKTAATIYHLLAAGLLALIPTACGIALGAAVIGREETQGGEAQ